MDVTPPAVARLVRTCSPRRWLLRVERNEAKLRRQRLKAPIHGHIRPIRYRLVELCSPRNAASATDAMREVAKAVRT